MSTDTSNSSGGGVYAEGDFITLEGNRFYNIGRFGPGENGAAPGNDYWQNHDHGVYLDGVSHVDIINNTFLAHEHGWGNSGLWWHNDRPADRRQYFHRR